MKIILSRKGFDSGYGGYPSAILPDGRLVSFPIPELESKVGYADLIYDETNGHSHLMADLFGDTIKQAGRGAIAHRDCGCHLDPDIETNVFPREPGWRGIMGQVGAAQTHLHNQNVEPGDIFLFFGWFRHVEEKDGAFSYSKSDTAGNHVMYGFLEIERIETVSSLRVDDWMKYHPHIAGAKSRYGNNTLYISRKRYSKNSDFQGFGVFKYSRKLQLTKEGLSRSKWDLPDFFRNTSISYHSQKSWKNGYFQSAMIGQEFVVECTAEIKAWVEDVIASGLAAGH